METFLRCVRGGYFDKQLKGCSSIRKAHGIGIPLHWWQVTCYLCNQQELHITDVHPPFHHNTATQQTNTLLQQPTLWHNRVPHQTAKITVTKHVLLVPRQFHSLAYRKSVVQSRSGNESDTTVQLPDQQAWQHSAGIQPSLQTANT